LRVWARAIERGTDSECYWVCCEGLAEDNIEELILNVTVIVLRFWGRAI
jgi:hypothetical protein